MTNLLPPLILLTSLIPALLTFLLPQSAHGWRIAINLGGAVIKLGLIAFLLVEVAQGAIHEWRLGLAPGLYLLLRVDALAVLFVSLSAFLWLLTTIYALAYLGTKPNLSRFFGFFSLCVAATTGIALSGTLISLFLFFELLTLSTWPLVAHRQDEKSIAAGRSYLAYALPASVVLLVAIVWLESTLGPIEFADTIALHRINDTSLRIIFALFVIGFGMKAALVPLHGWLPAAMAAPAPVSALLHAVAVVKAGAFGVMRIVLDVFTLDRLSALGLGLPLALIASATILWGSARALQQQEIKRRLAFSTVSQVSYIILGLALASPFGLIGGIVHLVHQGLMKITLFFCAGIYAARAGIHHIAGLDGIGPRMPWTSVCFSIGAIGMIGLPPTAGFITKFYLGIGALQAGMMWVVGVLAASTLLNAAYFLPLIYRIWLMPPAGEGTRMIEGGGGLALIAPAVITALASVLAGLLAASALSPLNWATFIAMGEYL